MRTISRASIGLAFSLGLAALAQAQGMPGGPGFDADCVRPKIMKACPDQSDRACMKAHMPEILAACGQTAKGAKRKRAKRMACKDLMEKYCHDAVPGTPEFSACMRKHPDLAPCIRMKKRASPRTNP